MKVCCICKKNEHEVYFTPKVKHICQQCKKIKTKEYNDAHRAEISAYNKRYLEEHKEEILEYHREYNLKNRDKISERVKVYTEINREKILENKRNYRKKNREELLKKEKIRRDLPESKEKRSAYHKQRKQNDIDYRLTCELRSHLCNIIKKYDGKKEESILELIGCTVGFLRKYIENQFLKGMNWENWGMGSGKWQIDHIRPIRSFDLKNVYQQRLCFNFSNLQPLWSEDNNCKNDKWDIIYQQWFWELRQC